ncbi:MAG: hypothetical protein J3K34DRAFT_452350 [Monoraphidium minutum]|nr:MAG: hypothetical protein J3K34DRAFT_452350 [Monoraphidium minutum]
MYGGGAGGIGGMYGSSMYGSSPYSSYGASYGGGAYGGSGYGGGMYGASSMYGGGGMYGGSSMYGGGGMYGRPLGGMYGGGAPPGFDPSQPPPAPPSAWQAALAALGGVVHFFGRLSFLVDENAHAVHFFIGALLQLLERTGSLYAEIARFILRVIFRRKRGPPKLPPAGGPGGGAPRPLAPGPWQPAAAGAWQPPALPPQGSGSPLDLAAGSHWDSLWSD